MKKFSKISSLLMLLIFFISANANAQNRFFLNPIDLEPGTTGTLELILINPETPFYGFSVDVTLPKGLEVVRKSDGKADVSLNADRLGSTYNLVTNIKDGKLLMGTFSSDPEKSIEGTSGAVAYINVKVASDFKESTLTLSNIKLINSADQDEPVTQQNATIGVLPSAIKITPSSIGFEIMEGNELEKNLSVTFTPSWTTNRILKWTTSDSDVATVDANGMVTAVYKGKATITATTVNGKTSTCYVSIGKPVTSVEMDPTSATIMDSETLTIKATPMPFDADNRDFVRWESSNEEIATVDENGLVTAKREGEVQISALCGSAVGTCTVTVIPTPAESVTIIPESAEVMVDKTVILTAVVLPEVTTDKTVIWSSSDPTKATVDENGMVKGVALGETIITATCGTATAVCNVTVIPTPALSISLDRQTAELEVNETITLIPTVLPEDVTDKTVIWSTNDESIVTVDADGKVTAVAVGQTIVTATCGTVTASCVVTVLPTPAESMTLNPTSVELKVGESAEISAEILPEDTTDKTVTWTTDDEAIATVDANGTVTGTGLGETTLKATCGTITASCKVKVVPTPVTGISLTNTTLLMKVGNISELAPIIQPADATDKSVTWDSEDQSIATVDENGMVTAIALGTVKIIVTSVSNPAVKAVCLVTVEPNIIMASNISLNETSIEMLEEETFDLIATVIPDDATDKTVTWESSDITVATVSENGQVTAVKAGVAVIYASTSSGLTAECAVTVRARVIEPTGISLTNTEMQMTVGDITDLIAVVSPDDATDKTVAWASEDESIATVDANGIVTAVNVGMTKITATTTNGIQAVCTVTVVPATITVESIELNRTELELTEGDNFTLIATVLPEDATDKKVTWESSDITVAAVSENGEVTAVSVGIAVIYASSSNGLTAECAVTVVPDKVEVTGITLSNTELTIREGHTAELIPIVKPVNADDNTVSWTTEDETIATVDANGIVTAVKVGVTKITATASNGMTAICTVTVVPDFTAIESIELNRTELELTEGDTFTLVATVLPENATDKTVTWKSSDKAVATVSENGEVTAVKVGTAVIYASSSNGITATCVVTVVAGEIAVQRITLSNTELLMKVGEISELVAIIHPSDASDQSVVWRSNNESLATVDQHGNVTAKAIGTTTVTVTSVAYPSVSAECKIIIDANVIAVAGIELNKSELSMIVGDKETLRASITPEDATDKTVTWKSSDPAVAMVSENGEVTAVSVGTAIIYASSSNGLTAQCDVTVNPGVIRVESITLSNSELVLREGHTADLIAIIRPSDATDQTVKWISNDESIATVDATGIVTAVKVGVTQIIATASNGMTAICTVTVVPDFTAIESIELNRTELELTEGDTFTLIATVMPENATDKTVTWKSSDPAVATVSETGEVTAVSAGTATIYASSSNGLTAECAVTVVRGFVEVTGISLSNTELVMTEGEVTDLIAIVRPFDATDQRKEWTSTDESIVTVDENGVVTAVRPSIAIITVTSVSNPAVKAECIVTVVPKFIAVTGIKLNKEVLDMVEGDTEALIATITPEDAIDKTVTWLSSNSNIATVSENGEVTAVGVGTAIIYASSFNGLTAICEVNVSPRIIEVTAITLDTTDLVLWEGETATLVATIDPEDATDKSVTWTSNYPEIAIVEDGVVKALKAGTATVIAKSSNGKIAYCSVTVKERPFTPRQLLRKGDGTTCTFVILMDLSDTELVDHGYQFVVGYTDSYGQSAIIAQTPLRYCHTTSEIFNNPSYDFWTFAFIENEAGEIACSNLRHLDGEEEVCFDPSIYGFDLSGSRSMVNDGGDWLTVTPKGLSISINNPDETTLAVYTASGVKVYSKTYSGETQLTDMIELTRFVPGSYLVTLNCAGDVKAKKILVR